MSDINIDFLKTGSHWQLSELQGMQYSFLSSLPSYYMFNPILGTAHAFLFRPGTGGFLTSNADPNFIDQQDIVRFLLDSPGVLSGYTDLKTVNTILINMASYRVSFSDVINTNFLEADSGIGDIIIMNQDAFSSAAPSLAYIPNATNKTFGNAGDVFINSMHIENLTELRPGAEGFWILLHELGHAVGGLDDVRNTTAAGTFVDNQKYTVMSYNPLNTLLTV